MVSQIQTDFETLNSITTAKKALYLIWKDPYMVAGKGTYIDEMMHLAGFKNLIKQTRYPTLEMDDIIALDPEVILLSSEPYPFKYKHIRTFQDALPNTAIELVNGEMFSWYGSRLLQAASYFNDLHEKLTDDLNSETTAL